MTTDDLNTNAADTPYADAPAGDDPQRGREVYAPTDGPFEVPAKTIEKGPYFKSIEEVMPDVAMLPETEAALAREAKKLPVDRRDFMKLFSASSLAATTACIRRPVEKAIPYVNQPIDQVPGEPVFYASTCGECSSGCGIMVRTREGRPTKIEGLPEHPISNGRLCAVGQSSLQGLFHPERPKAPQIRFGQRYTTASWNDVFEHLAPKLASGKVGIVTSGSTGHRHEFYREFLTKIGSSPDRLYAYDSNGLFEAITAAHRIAYGVSAMPRPDLHQAKLIVGIGADVVGGGISPVYQEKAYTESHSYKNGAKGRHVQFEAAFSTSGAKADERHVIPPGSETLATLLLVSSLIKHPQAKGTGAARAEINKVLTQKADLISGGYDRVGVSRETFDRLAADMLATPSVVMCGGSAFDENETNLQLAAIMANELVGAYDTILHLSKGWMVPPVVPGAVQKFLAEAGSLDVLIVIDQDPAFNLPPALGAVDLLKKIPTVVSIQDFVREVDAYAHYRLNAHHYLESWGDEQPVAGFYSARQPTVRPTTDSRQAEEILMWLAATAKKPLGYADYRSYLMNKWSSVQQVSGVAAPFEAFFDAALHRGFAGKIATQGVGGMSGDVAASFKYVDGGSSGLRLIAPLDQRLGDGKHAFKPVLQEAADPLTTITWDTFVAVNPQTMAKLGIRQYDVVTVEGVGGSFEGSVYPLPGLHPDAVVVPRGNGHTKNVGTIEGGHGVNPLVALAKAVDAHTGAPVTSGQAVKLTRTGKIMQLAALQKHNDIANRTDIVKKISVAKANANATKKRNLEDVPDLFPALPKSEYRWGMSIDLDKCTGCQACVVACAVENNIPQVGREQVLLGREMHWIKIDRYFYGDVANPQVSLQPMLCQHCQHAPCEAVCPVYATTHDSEGFNAMTYNRCIGTRYCANACPYKIRRFNWWTHRWGVMGERLQDRNPRAMNPDVTVRTRGVMEKCTFCYQRVRDAKHRAKLRGTPLQDGELQVACQQTCPAEAITFGNLHDPGSAVSALRQEYRAYMALGGDPDHKHYGLKTLPAVTYLSEVHHKEPVVPGHHGDGHGDGGSGDHHG